MKKADGFTKRMVAILLSSMLAVGTIPGTTLAAEVQENTVQEEEAIITYAVTLDANGGYFVNEWDDVLGDYIESTEILNKQIPVGGTVTTFPVYETDDQQTQAMSFSGWSLERDGELESQGDEEYTPVDNCVLYAVWESEEIPENIDDTDMEESNLAEDVSEDDSLVEQEATDDHPENEENIGDTEYFSDDSEDIEETGPENVNREDHSDNIIEEGKEDSVRTDAVSSVVASGKCGNNLTWTVDNAGTLTISGTGEMSNWSYTKQVPWNSYTIYSVIIRNGVTSIGWCAFAECSTLTSVTIPSGVTSIGDLAFDGCSSLKSVAIPSGVTSIGACAFSGCTNLTNITIPNTVTSIGEECFYLCENLHTVTIPDSVTSIGDFAFSNCISLTSVHIPSSVTDLGYAAFCGCKGIKSVTIPPNIEHVHGTFVDCTGLEEVTISEGIKCIDKSAFSGCSSLKSVLIPNSLTRIGSRVFEDCTSLTSVTISNSVTEIGKLAFGYCKKLKVIYFLGHAPEIFSDAFTDVLAVAYYPAKDGTWTVSKKVNYGGVLTWKEDAQNDDFMSTGNGRFNFSDMYGFRNLKVKISKRMYEKFFSKSQAKELHEKYDKEKHGICAGMVITAMATLIQNSPSISSYGVKSLHDIENQRVKSSTTGISVLDYAKYGHIAQLLPPVQIAFNKNSGDLQGLYRSVLEYANGASDKPVLIKIQPEKEKDGHSLWALGVSQADTSNVTINVYDPNHPEGNRELLLFKESGRFKGWRYELDEGRIWSGDVKNNLGCLSYETVSKGYFVLYYATKVYYKTSDFNIITFDMSDMKYDSAEEWAHEQQYSKNLLPINVASDDSQESSNILNYWYIGSQGDLNFENIPAGVRVSYATLNDSLSIYSDQKYNASFSGETSCNSLKINCDNNGYLSATYYRPEQDSNHVDQLMITGTGKTVEINNNDGGIEVSGVNGIHVSLESGEENEDGVIVNPKISTHDDDNISTNDDINISISNKGDLSVETIKVLSSGKCGENLTWTLDERGKFTVSGTGEMYNYSIFVSLQTRIPTERQDQGVPDFFKDGSYKKIKKIIIKEGVTSIGDGAFSYAGVSDIQNQDGYFTGISLPKSLKSIGRKAFWGTGCDEIIIDTGASITIESDAFDVSRFKKLTLGGIEATPIMPKTVQQVTLKEGVRTISQESFNGCKNLKEVSLPEGITSINRWAFGGCTSLKSIGLPRTLKSIGQYAFSESGLENIDIPDSVDTIINEAFRGCKSLKSFRLSSSITDIGYGWFQDCDSLSKVTIPEGVKTIGVAAFYDCDMLKSINLPTSLTAIYSSAFGNCNSLKQINIPANVSEISLGAGGKLQVYSPFTDSLNLTTINVASANKNFKSYDGCLYNSNMSELIYCPEGKKDITIASTTTNINQFAFVTSKLVGHSDVDPKLNAIYFMTCSPSIPERAFQSITASAYYNNFLNNWSSDKCQNYGGTITWIEKSLNISDCNITVSPSSFTYDGTAKKPTASLTFSEKTLINNTDYTVSYTNNTNAGTATITTTGKGKYSGVFFATFNINKADQSITAKTSAASIAVGKTATVSTTGNKGNVTYTSSNTAIATVNASTGVVTGKKAGTVTITATSAATANYNAASKTVKITVTAGKSLKKPGNCHFAKWNNSKYTSCRISWNKVDGAEGYETLLSWTNGSNASRTIVKSNVLYRDCTVHPQHVSQMMVRAFYTAGGKRVFGPWSNVEYITPSPTKLTTKNASSGTNLKMNISWNIIYGCNGYNVFLTTNPNGTWYWNQSTSTKADATSAVITKYRGSKLKKNTRYYVRIVTRRQRNGVFCTVPMPASNTYIGSFIIK